MAQKTNLNVSPYFDDFDNQKDFYKVLFTPGRPVQARELNNIPENSILKPTKENKLDKSVDSINSNNKLGKSGDSHDLIFELDEDLENSNANFKSVMISSSDEEEDDIHKFFMAQEKEIRPKSL